MSLPALKTSPDVSYKMFFSYKTSVVNLEKLILLCKQ